MRRAAFAAALVAGLAAVASAQPPDERPNFFGLYPPPNPGTVTPTRPPASATFRRPSLFDPVPVYPRRDTLLWDGAIDLRLRTSQKNTTGTYVAATRLTLDYIRASKTDGDERGGVRVQTLVETDDLKKTATRRVRLSELYGFYKFLFPGVSATLKVGQFVLPFGLAAIHDTPLLPIQTLYATSLGLRVDSGAMLEGSYGPYRWAGSLTTGAGPNRSDFDSDKVFAFRLERNFLTQAGRIQIGGSLLSGRLPVTGFGAELPASGFSRERRYVDKTRFAADASYYLEKLTARGEFIFGADGQESAWGYFGDVSYPFARRWSAAAFLRGWHFATTDDSAFFVAGLGADYDLGRGLVLRSLFEFDRELPLGTRGTRRIDKRLTIQTLLRF